MNYVDYTEDIRQQLISKGYTFLQIAHRIPADTFGGVDFEDKTHYELIPTKREVNNALETIAISSAEAIAAISDPDRQYHIYTPF